ncbi:alanine racemase [Candidatus Falkowbacteria bacterium]|nr:alanine racemase [Candidatus Falkowbacteria bacterium]
MYNSWVEISKFAILHNLVQYQKMAGKGVEVMPVVKSNAYGHGMTAVARLVAPKVKWIGVVNLGEALALRKSGIKKRIFVLSYADSKNQESGIKKSIDFPVYSLESAREISAKAKRLKMIAKIHIKIDTGTSRVGVLAKEAVSFIKKVKALPNLKIEGIYSHFAASEEDRDYTKKQLDNFNLVLAGLEKENIKIPYKHFGCSAASLVSKDSHFNMIRLGLSLYGLWPAEQVKRIALKNQPGMNLKPALSWKTKILQVKEIPKGTKVGYGLTYTAKKKMKIAILAVGYFEGYDRHLSNKGEVIIKNKKCPVIGRVCMNLTMVDVSKLKEVRAGDEVVLLGEEVPAEDLAEKIGTINDEIVTRINPVLERRYL